MYQLIVIVVQFCFPYPKGKPSIESRPDQVTPPVVTSSMGKMLIKGAQGKHEDPNGARNAIDGDEISASSEQPTSRLSGCPGPVADGQLVQNNVTVSYSPPRPFEQLRSSRPNCFISSITRFEGQLPSPGSAVKTTSIKSPEEVTGVKSPSPEAWRVAIETGNGINWTQTKPASSPLADHIKINNLPIESKTIEGLFKQTVNLSIDASQSTDNQEQLTVPDSNKPSDGSQAIQIVTKETLL